MIGRKMTRLVDSDRNARPMTLGKRPRFLNDESACTQCVVRETKHRQEPRV